MRSISLSDFENWGVSYYEAMEAACENLLESSIAFSQISDGFYSAVSGDSYDSARILLRDQLWRADQAELSCHCVTVASVLRYQYRRCTIAAKRSSAHISLDPKIEVMVSREQSDSKAEKTQSG